jgi:PAS domain S-box-containing protein
MHETVTAGIQVGCGTAKGKRALTVGRNAARRAMDTITKHDVSVVLVFASVKYDLPALLEGIRRVIPDAPLLGTTTAGEICNAPQQESAVVVVLASPYLKVRVGLAKGVSRDWRGAVAEAVSTPDLMPFFTPHDRSVWADLAREGKTAFGMLFSPGSTKQANSWSYWILEELKRLSEGLLPIFGGSSADDWRMESNCVFLDKEVHPDSVLLAVFETSLRFGIGLSHGFVPGKKRATVTSASENDILTLDNEPAADVYARMLGSSRRKLEGKHLTLTTGRPAGTPDPYGQFSISVASFFTPEGGVRLSQPVREGTSLIIMEPDKDSVVAAGQEAARKALLRGGINDPAICLVFSCALRPRILKKRTSEEIARIVELMPNTPVAGFYSFGEQGVTDDGVNRHNNEVVTVLVLGRELTRAAEVAVENRSLVEALDQDVARRREAEEALRDKEEALRATLDSTADGILAVDDKGRVIFANRRFARMWRIPPDLMESGNDDELLDFVLDQLADPDGFMAKVHELYGSVREDFDVLRFRDGRLFERYSRPLARGNTLAGRVWSFRDVTERAGAEEQLQKSEERYRFLVESIPGCVSELDAHGKVLYMNRDFAGRSLDEVTGTPLYDYVHREQRDSLRNALNDAARTNKNTYCEASILVPEGTREWGFHVCPIIEGNVVVKFLLIGTDITEHKQAEERRREFEVQMQHAQKLESLGLLAGGIAHDFNNLLMAILGNADLLLEDLPPDHSAHESLLEIERAARNAAELCKQMLAYSGKSRLAVETLNLNDVVTEMAHLLQVSISKKVPLRYNLAEDLPAVQADPAQVRQVIMNLITNASDAIGDKKGLISITTGSRRCDKGFFRDSYFDRIASEGVYVYIEIADTGCGMDADTAKRIFDPFFTTKFAGRGLGLAAVLGIIRGHSGAIRVQSEPGKGTIFQVFFPAVGQNDRVAAKGEKPVAGWRGSGTVLLVDDEEVIRVVGLRMLSRIGFEVLTAVDGSEAVALFRKHVDKIVCVLLDLTMPGVDGEKTFRALREVREDVRVVLISGHAEEEIAHRFEGMGLAGFIHKPFSLGELTSKLRDLLEP